MGKYSRIVSDSIREYQILSERGGIDIDQELQVLNTRSKWGKLRTGSVMISGTDYLPPVPKYETVCRKLNEILEADTSATKKRFRYSHGAPEVSFSGMGINGPV